MFIDTGVLSTAISVVVPTVEMWSNSHAKIFQRSATLPGTFIRPPNKTQPGAMPKLFTT